MAVLGIYLHGYVYDYLHRYGDLDAVVDKILKAGTEGKIDIMNKPPAPERDVCTKYYINVHDEEYNMMLAQFGAKSQHISLRRLLYWFVDNEVDYLLGWTPVASYEPSIRTKKYLALSQALDKLTKLYPLCSSHEQSLIKAAVDLIKGIDYGK